MVNGLIAFGIIMLGIGLYIVSMVAWEFIHPTPPAPREPSTYAPTKKSVERTAMFWHNRENEDV